MRNAFLLLALLLASEARAQPGSQFTKVVGELYCSAIKRSSDTVHVYCFGPGNAVSFNAMATVQDRVVVPWMRKRGSDPANLTDFDSIVWQFIRTGPNEISGEVVGWALQAQVSEQKFKLTAIKP